MQVIIRDWLTGFTCGPCRADIGSERRAGVLVVVQEHGQDLEIIPLCYKHAGIYVSRWVEPSPVTIAGAFQELAYAASVFGLVLIGAIFKPRG